MKTNILKCCAAALVLAGGVSCTDLLDMTPTNLVSDKTMWEKTENIFPEDKNKELQWRERLFITGRS